MLKIRNTIRENVMTIREYLFGGDEKQDGRQANNDLCLSQVMSTPAGRRIIFTVVFKYAGICEALPFCDPSLTAQAEGKRKIGISVLKDLKRVCPARITEMLAENIEDL